jgi:hypothetical protein
MQSGSLERTVLRTVAVLNGAALAVVARQATASSRAIRIFERMSFPPYWAIFILTPFVAASIGARRHRLPDLSLRNGSGWWLQQRKPSRTMPGRTFRYNLRVSRNTL